MFKYLGDIPYRIICNIDQNHLSYIYWTFIAKIWKGWMGGIVFDSSGQEVDQQQKMERGVPNVYSRTEPYLDEHPDLEPLPGLGQQEGVSCPFFGHSLDIFWHPMGSTGLNSSSEKLTWRSGGHIFIHSFLLKRLASPYHAYHTYIGVLCLIFVIRRNTKSMEVCALIDNWHITSHWLVSPTHFPDKRWQIR